MLSPTFLVLCPAVTVFSTIVSEGFVSDVLQPLSMFPDVDLQFKECNVTAHAVKIFHDFARKELLSSCHMLVLV